MKEILLIPHERLDILRNEGTKLRIEKELNVKLIFIENSVEVDGEGFELFKAINIIRAMARGFSPENAFRLLDDDEQIEVIELKYSANKLKVVKARLIGSGGKTRKLIERCSGCNVSIYGKTISLIGKFEQLKIAGDAVKMILYGSKLTNVYGFLLKAKNPFLIEKEGEK
jgi:ribosomal RNA assembly protein